MGSTDSTASSPVYYTLITMSYAASKTIVSSVVVATYILLIGCLGCCVLELHRLNHGLNLLDLCDKLLLIVLYCICDMVHLWIL